MTAIELIVNGKKHSIDVDPSTPLLWVLREYLGYTGTKYGCGIAQCGACTVHINGHAQRCCVLPVEAVAGAEITTIEGLSAQGDHILQKLWTELNVPQCGYCQSGMLMAAADLLASSAVVTSEIIDDRISNICRCGTYPRIKAAILRAAQSSQR